MFGVNPSILNPFHPNGVSVVLIPCLCSSGTDRVNAAHAAFTGASIFGSYFLVTPITSGGSG